MSVTILKLAAVAVTMTVAAGSAQAANGSPATVVQQAVAEPGSATKSGEKKYCVRATNSGSRMPQKVCRTRKAWMAEGFDPTAPK